MSEPEFRPLTSGAVRSGLSQVFSVVAGGLTVLVLARILGPEGAGTYAVALSLLLGLLTFGTLSLQTGISYFVGGGEWQPRRALRDTQVLAVVLGVTAVAAGLGIRSAVPSAFRGLDADLVLLTAAGVPFALSWTFASAVALAVDQYDLFALPPVLQSGLGLVLIVTLGAVDGVRGAIMGMTISHAVAAAITLAWCVRALPHDKQHSGAGELGRAIVFGLKSHVANTFAFVTYRLDIFILNGTASAAQVGQYSIAVSATQAIWLLPRALGAVVTPRVARVSAGPSGGAEYQELVERKSMRHATILALVSGVGVAVALGVLVLVYLGPRFQESIVLGIILLPGSMLLGISGALSAIFMGRGRPEYSLIGAVATAPVAVALYFLLIPALGAAGAALASSLSYAFGFWVSLVLGRHMLHRKMLRLIVPTRSEFGDYRALLATLWARRRT